jgi:methylated-DNA-[protein]-cysteine S-methyltransferase
MNTMWDEKGFQRTIATWLGDEESQVEKGVLETALDELYAEGPDVQRKSNAQKYLRTYLAEIQSKTLYYDVMEDSPIGSICIAVGKNGLVGIEIGVTEAKFVARLEKRFGSVAARSPRVLRDVIEQLDEYFKGRRSSFKLRVSLDHLTLFQQKVLLATSDIPHGEITTYGEVARRLGKVQLARAVGQALARNPIPIVIPCHRVLASDGSLHGYSGGKGLETKKKLLLLEGALGE